MSIEYRLKNVAGNGSLWAEYLQGHRINELREVFTVIGKDGKERVVKREKVGKTSRKRVDETIDPFNGIVEAGEAGSKERVEYYRNRVENGQGLFQKPPE